MILINAHTCLGDKISLRFLLLCCVRRVSYIILLWHSNKFFVRFPCLCCCCCSRCCGISLVWSWCVFYSTTKRKNKTSLIKLMISVKFTRYVWVKSRKRLRKNVQASYFFISFWYTKNKYNQNQNISNKRKLILIEWQ